MMVMGGIFDDEAPIPRGLRAEFGAQAPTNPALDERALCRYAESALRLAYRGTAPKVTAAPDRPPQAFGALDVRLEWPGRPDQHPLTVRVVVADELARGAWREAATAIGDAVRAAFAARRPADPPPKREGPSR